MKERLCNIFNNFCLAAAFILTFTYTKSFAINFSIVKVILVFIVGFCAFILKNKIKLLNIKKVNIFLFIVAFATALGKICRDATTLRCLAKVPNILLFVICIIGFYYFNRIVVSLIYYIYIFIDNKKVSSNKFIKKFDEHLFLISFIFVMCSLVIYYIVFYPTTIDTDPILQLAQFASNKIGTAPYDLLVGVSTNWSNHYPIFHTMVLGYFFWFGKIFVNDNFGLFLYTFIQGIIFSLTAARSIIFFKKRKIKNRYLFMMLIFYMTCPIYGFYILNLNKDVYYAIIMVNLVISIFEYLEDKKISLKRVILFFCMLTLLCLLRNNGIYVIYFLFPFMLFYEKKNIKYFLPIFLIIISLNTIYVHILLPKWGVEATTLNEVLSVPFQQTARYVKYHDREVTEKEKKAINKVLDYDIIRKKYKPYLSDNVKNTYREDVTKEDLISYFKVWFNEGLKHPITYIDATLANMFGYYDVLYYQNSKTAFTYYIEYPRGIFDIFNINYHFTSPLVTRQFLDAYSKLYEFFPLTGIFVNIAVNNWLIIGLGIYVISKKQKKYLIGLLPLYVTYLVCDVSPVNYYFRYALPCMFLMPFIIVMFIYIHNKYKIKN